MKMNICVWKTPALCSETRNIYILQVIFSIRCTDGNNLTWQNMFYLYSFGEDFLKIILITDTHRGAFQV